MTGVFRHKKFSLEPNKIDVNGPKKKKWFGNGVQIDVAICE